MKKKGGPSHDTPVKHAVCVIVPAILETQHVFRSCKANSESEKYKTLFQYKNQKLIDMVCSQAKAARIPHTHVLVLKGNL